MKKLKSLIAMLLCAAFLIQLSGCCSDNDTRNDTTEPVNGATVFHALKSQVDFDSELSEVDNAEDLFENLPDGAEVTLLTGPNQLSDQLGMIQVEDKKDLDDAEESVNGYLQDMYDSATLLNPNEAEKFENVAMWKYEVYIIFCITINYTKATEIINNTVNDGTPQPSNKPDNDMTETNPVDQFLGRWEITGHPVVKEEIDSEFLTTVEVSSSSVTLLLYGESFTSNSFEIIEVQGYPCLLAQMKGMSMALILINPDMLVFSSSGEVIDDITLQIQGKEYGGEFSPIANVFMREGSGTTNVPESINFAEREIEADKNEFYLFYYPASSVLQVWGSNSYERVYCEGVVYVYNSGAVEYMEVISLPWATGLPYDTIYTDHNFVITDND